MKISGDISIGNIIQIGVILAGGLVAFQVTRSDVQLNSHNIASNTQANKRLESTVGRTNDKLDELSSAVNGLRVELAKLRIQSNPQPTDLRGPR